MLFAWEVRDCCIFMWPMHVIKIKLPYVFHLLCFVLEFLFERERYWYIYIYIDSYTFLLSVEEKKELSPWDDVHLK